MKLWLKVSLISTILVTAAISACGLIMLIRSGRSNLDLAVENTLANQEVRAASWATAMQTELADSTSSSAQRSIARYFIDKYADGNTILETQDDCIYNRTAIEPQAYLKLSGKQQQYIIEDIGGKSMLIAGRRITVEGVDYLFYLVSDLTSVYDGITEMSYRFALINCIVMVTAAAVTVFLVRRLLYPVKELKHSTALIADGVYDKRIEIRERDEIGELGEDFNRMAEAVEAHIGELREEAERRTMFMSALTHELKTPMTSIKGNAQTLLATKLTEAEREDALYAIDAACTRVERLSQKLMQLIVLRQSGELELSADSVPKLLLEAQSACARQLKQRGLTLKIDSGMDTLVMERDLLLDLLINLIDNAGKASKPGDVIELCARDGVISVSDHGIGIARSELGKLTQPFYMVDKSRTRRAGGAGLGLALSDEIARLHGARLIIDSVMGEGTTVSVVFDMEGVQDEETVQ